MYGNLNDPTLIKPGNFLRHMWKSRRAFDLISAVNKMDDVRMVLTNIQFLNKNEITENITVRFES
jgi:hypothetical protein